MDFFDLSKEFEAIYVEKGETDGAVSSKTCHLLEQIGKREKRGSDYVTHQAYVENAIIQKNDEQGEFSGRMLPSVDDLEWTTAGMTANVDEFNTEKVHNIYNEYYENKPKPSTNLLINEYKRKILSIVEANEVTILTGPTGCGKTTQVPQFILDSNIEKNKYCNIVVTQPRRIAAISIAKRVCEERDWELGKLCGFKIGLKNCICNDTLLTFMTTGVLLQTLVSKKHMHSYTHIILDEIHERDQSMDFILIVIKKLLNSASHSVKVILMSATVEAMKFANYFQKNYMGKLQCAPVISIQHSTNYCVQIHYLEELSALGELPEISNVDPHISELSFDICVRLIKQFEKIDHSECEKKSVLIFLPGLYEIEYLYNKLTDPKIYSAGSIKYKWCPLPLHSSITTEEQVQAFLPPPSGYRKIILSTNIAESSITVPGVKFVIDFCLTKSLKTDASNFSSLRLCWASQANCVQRAGRVGRVMDGRVYRMVYKDFYQNLEKESPPEMVTAPLEKIVLLSKMLDMGEPKAILAMAPDPPDLTNIEWTILILKEAGGLLRTRDGISTSCDGDLTYLGRLMAILPVDIQITRLIVMGHLFSCLEECIIIGACMSLKSVFSHPFKIKLKAYNSKLEWADGSCSDCIAFLNVYEVWCNNHRNGYFKRSAGDNEVKWARRHLIQLRVLKEVKILVDDLTLRLRENHIEEPVGAGKVQWNDFQKALVLKVAIGGAFYPNYFGRGLLGGQINEKFAVKTLCGRNPFTTVYLSNFPADQPLELYSQLIKDELSECNEDMIVTSDRGSKIYLEFRKSDSMPQSGHDMPLDGTLPGKIPMGVYRAVKMRQIKKKITIKLLPTEEAQKRASLGMRSQFELEEERSEADGSQMVPASLPSLNVSCMQLVITHVVNPGHFWAYDMSNSENQRKIFLTLNNCDNKLVRFDKTPAIGEMCVAPHEENGEICLYRARVTSVDNKKAQVFFIDYGNCSTVNEVDLRQFTPKLVRQLGNIPAQVFECVLSEIRPSVIMNPTGNWSQKSLLAFNKLTETGCLFGSIYSIVNGIVSLELFKRNNQNEQISINKFLINKGYAEQSEENYLSKMDNIKRSKNHSDSVKNKSVCSPIFEELWNVKPIELSEPKDCTMNVQLRGPFSPLEMRIYPYVRCALDAQIRIGEESVNSVLLDTDPQDKHERLIVASNINQNSAGSSLILNNITVMPNIHGLAAIIPLIFAPKIELRVNNDRTHFTGMLCGLGADENGEPIFPEHDFEVYFDCDITFEDFTTINQLRYFMSLLLLTEGEEPCPYLSYPDIIKCQKKIQSGLLSLLSKKRKSKDVEYGRQEYKWKLIKSDLFVENRNSDICNRFQSRAIFPFHPGISIRSSEEENSGIH